MYKYFLILIGTIIFAQSPVELQKAAQTNLDSGNISEAEVGFNAAIQADPTFAPAYLGLAHTLMRKGDLKKTGNYLKEAIEIEPENQDFRDEFERLSELNTLMNRGIRSMKNGDADNAFESFRVAYEKFPNYPESVFNMGLTLFRKKDFNEAVQYFNKALEINPEHKTASAAIKNVAKNYFNNGNQSYKRGVIQSKMGDKDLAAKSYEKALDVNPQFYKGFFALGLAKSSLNDNDGALAALQSAIDIYPGYDKAYGAMGDIYIGSKNYDKAKQVLNMAITVNPNYSRGYANLGIIHSDEENWDSAISSLEMAVALNEKDSMSFFRLASMSWELLSGVEVEVIKLEH